MGEKKKEEEKKPKGGGGGENAAAAPPAEVGPTPVVLKVDMHCEGCALKIKRAAKGFPGVEAVAADRANNRLTVIGSADPLKIRERLESKTRKKVDLISPVPKKDPAPKESEPKKGQSDPKEQKKPKAPASKTVVLKIRLHCDGCIQRIRKTILRYKGVDGVAVDSEKDLVTVMGTMDVNSLAPYLKDKLKRSVEIVPMKKDNGNGGEKKDKPGVDGKKKDIADRDGKKNDNIGKDNENKDENDEDNEKKEMEKNGQKKKKDENGEKKDNNGDSEKKNNEEKNTENGKKKKNGEKKEKSGNGGKKNNGGNDWNGKKKENGKGGAEKKQDGGGEKEEGGDNEKQVPIVTIEAPIVTTEANKMEYYGPYGYDSINNRYHIVMVHGPQMFSDENPNACSIM